MIPLQKRPLTPTYLFFYILFWPDTWQIAIGLLAAWLLPPFFMPPDASLFKTVMVFIMMGCIGYAVSGVPARAISRLLRKMLLGAKHP